MHLISVRHPQWAVSVPGRVADCLPQLRYLLIDENRYGEAELAAMHNLVATIIRFEHPANDQALLALIDLLNDWLAGRPELKRLCPLDPGPAAPA